VLVLAWKFKAQVQGEFTKDEFYNAMNELGWVLIFDFLKWFSMKYCRYTTLETQSELFVNVSFG
jgi:hypothetical protein